MYYQDFLRSEEARVEHWDFKLEGWPLFGDAAPTPAHEAVAALERAGKVGLVVTQNVDGLHARAGTSRERLVEIHGTNAAVECLTCGARSDPEPHLEAFRRTRVPPRCGCGGLLKSATISFGQDLVAADLERAAAGARSPRTWPSPSARPCPCTPPPPCPWRRPPAGPPTPSSTAARPSTTAARRSPWRLEGDVQELFPPAVEAALAAGG